jgi:hypothetical protein
MTDLTKWLLKNMTIRKMVVWGKNDRWKICIRKMTILTKRPFEKKKKKGQSKNTIMKKVIKNNKERI